MMSSQHESESIESVRVQQDPDETSSKTSSSVSQPWASANGARRRLRSSKCASAICRLIASRTNSLLPLPVRAASSRSWESSLSSIRMVKVVMYYNLTTTRSAVRSSWSGRTRLKCGWPVRPAPGRLRAWPRREWGGRGWYGRCPRRSRRRPSRPPPRRSALMHWPRIRARRGCGL